MKWLRLRLRGCKAGPGGPARSFAFASLAALSLVSVPQEIEIGREANAAVRKETPELHDAQVNAYVQRIGKRLARAAPGARYPYSFHVANYREINAF